MAIIEDMDYPRLTPPGDRHPSSGSLFRTPQDLTDEQFDLLAAARAENALSDEGLSELNLILSASPDRLAYADSFIQLRLRPCDDAMEGLDDLLKTAPLVKTIRRSLLAAVAAAAVILAFTTIRLFTERQTDILKPAVLSELTIVAEKGNTQVVNPAMIQKHAEAESFTASKEVIRSEPEAIIPAIAGRITPLATASQAAMPVLASMTRNEDLIHVSFRSIPVPATTRTEENWIVKGIASISDAVRKDNKTSDSYVIADACIKAINRILGSEMELKRVMSETGGSVSVNFSSSILSFSAPVKKTTP
jgi:hypothetical protein